MNSVEKQVKNCEALIQLAAAGARGVQNMRLQTQDDDVLRMAAEQNLMLLLSCTALLSPGQVFSATTEMCLLDILRRSSPKNLLRTQRILYLIKQMEDAGISVRVLKGCSIARLYAYPESRDSIDSDLLIERGQEKAVYQFLQDHGFSINGRALTANDSVCEHGKYGKIEIHIGLYPEITERTWECVISPDTFLCEESVRIKTMNGSFRTLGYTDQLVFLSLHMAKHFIESGLTIQMALDIALHFSEYKNVIDTERYWRILRKLNLDRLLENVLWILIRTGVFSPDDFPGLGEIDSHMCDAILIDLIQGGYMGSKEQKERHGAGMEYHRQVILRTQSNMYYQIYMRWWKLRSGLKNMFPSYARLEKMYPILKKCSAFAPAMWIYRAAVFSIVKIKSGILYEDIRNDKSSMSEASSKRVKLFKELGMI